MVIIDQDLASNSDGPSFPTNAKSDQDTPIETLTKSSNMMLSLLSPHFRNGSAPSLSCKATDSLLDLDERTNLRKGR